MEARRTQAERIFARFGGVPALHKALADANRSRARSSIYKWNLPKESQGTGGYVPSSAQDDVKAAARFAGIVLTAEDWAP